MVAALVAHGGVVAVVDDHPAPAARAAAELASVELVEAPVGAAAGDARRGGRRRAAQPRRARSPSRVRGRAGRRRCRCSASSTWPRRGTTARCVAITGTDGKTTVTTLVTEMLEASGRAGGGRRQHRGAARRGHRRPRPRRVRGRGVVVPARPHAATSRRPSATWLNFAPDHLDVHDTVEALRGRQGPHLGRPRSRRGVAVANADDPVVMARRNPRCRTVTFGVDHPADYHLDGDALVAPAGDDHRRAGRAVARPAPRRGQRARRGGHRARGRGHARRRARRSCARSAGSPTG